MALFALEILLAAVQLKSSVLLIANRDRGTVSWDRGQGPTVREALAPPEAGRPQCPPGRVQSPAAGAHHWVSRVHPQPVNSPQAEVPTVGTGRVPLWPGMWSDVSPDSFYPLPLTSGHKRSQPHLLRSAPPDATLGTTGQIQGSSEGVKAGGAGLSRLPSQGCGTCLWVCKASAISPRTKHSS